jgi:hypothetical protein
MPKVFIFHGTGGYPEENWFPWLRTELENLGCKVIVPLFPTPENQTPEGWFEVFNQYRNEIDAETILVGHSLGGSFLLRVLETLKTPIKAAFLVATPIGIPPIVNWAGDEPFTGHPFDWEKIKKNCHKFYIYHSDDDPYVGLENGKQLAKQLNSQLIFKPKSGHFNKKAGFTKFDDLLDNIKGEVKVFQRWVSVILFYNKKGQILLQGRSGKVSKSGEEWGFFGGGIDEGETPEQAILREVKEELGYDLKKVIKIGNYENQYYNPKAKAHRKLYRTIFATPLNDKIINSKVIEGDKSKLFTTDEAKGLKIIPGDKEVIEIFEAYWQSSQKQ